MLSIDFKVKFFLSCNFYLTSGSLPAAQKSHYHTSPLYTARQKIMNMNDLKKVDGLLAQIREQMSGPEIS